MGLGIPRIHSDNKTYWMFIFGLPFVTSCVQLMLLLSIFTYDTPKSLVIKDDIEQVKEYLHNK